jgi:hypothetical protein
LFRFLSRVATEGAIGLRLGNSSADARARAGFTVTGTLDPVPTVVTVQPAASGDAAQDIPQRVFFPVGATITPTLRLR